MYRQRAEDKQELHAPCRSSERRKVGEISPYFHEKRGLGLGFRVGIGQPKVESGGKALRFV